MTSFPFLCTETVTVPPYLPDTPEVRNDLLDYYFAVQRFDRDLGQVLEALVQPGFARRLSSIAARASPATRQPAPIAVQRGSPTMKLPP